MERNVYRHKVQYYETDKMGIVHHSNYIRWMEEGRIDYLAQCGLPYEKLESLGIMLPVLMTQCEHKTMARFGETVCIETEITAYNGVRLEAAYIMRDAETGQIRAVGKSRHCFLGEDGTILKLQRKYPELHKIFACYAEKKKK